jgi:SAM-dependent methyltransferase
VPFYVDQARASGGPVVELGVGTGRVAIPTAQAGIRVIGVDASNRMLEICRRRAAGAGVADRVDLRHGDFRSPPVTELVPLVTCPRLSFLHLEADEDRRGALSAIHRMLKPKGRFVFDVFAPSESDFGPRDFEWIKRASELWTKDDFDWDERVFRMTVRTRDGDTTLRFSWITRDEWRKLFDDCGFAVEACYGWFDLSPCGDSMYSVWTVERVA